MPNVIIGLILIAAGILIVKEFPDISGYQRSEMTYAGILFGIILIAIGIILMVW